MNITIVGGGNIGTQFAVHCAEKNHRVKIYTSTPDLFGKYLETVDDSGNITHSGFIEYATDNPHDAFSDADVIIVTFPSDCMKNIADVIYKNCNGKSWICVVPGNGGSECAFRKCIEQGNLFFAIERVPAVARLVKKGKTVRSTGYRNELHVASLPASQAQKCAEFTESIFDIPCKPIPNILNLSMTPSNPILHTVRLMTIFRDYKKGKFYEKLPLFYQEWNDESSELLFKCDGEVQKICASLPCFDLSYVKSLKEHYESPTISEFTAKICGIQAFKGLKTPSVKTGNGYIPDLSSRYFTADFSYGLSLMIQIADFTETDIPNMKSLMKWYDGIRTENNGFRYQDYGITCLNDFIDYYSL